MALITALPPQMTSHAPVKIIHGAENVAPAAGTVLADSGQLAAGTYLAVASVHTDDAILQTTQLVHRNAADGADVELSDGFINAASPFLGAWFTVVSNERVVVRNRTIGTAAKVYQVDLYIFVP